jgi:hypothetical protein
VAPFFWAMVGAYQRHGACGFIVLFFCFSFLCCPMAGPGRGSLVERSLLGGGRTFLASNGFTMMMMN